VWLKQRKRNAEIGEWNWPGWLSRKVKLEYSFLEGKDDADLVKDCVMMEVD